VGLTAKAMQAQLGIPEPLFGFLLQSGYKYSGTVLDHSSQTRPAFENELCLTLGNSLRC
jgi:2-oxo-hept-3-ene-1,7-dioate hydratase/2-keto-4-pentenoate hydratase